MAKKPKLEIPGLDITRAKQYSRVRLGVLLLGTAWSIGRMAWLGLGGRSARLRDVTRNRVPDERLATPTFVAAMALGSWVSGLPLSYLGGHRIERRFGLTKQTSRSWFLDSLKGFLLGLVFEVPLTTAAYAVIRRRPRDGWAILAGSAVPLSVALSNLAPVLILPLFNRFERLEDESLVGRIKRLGERAGVPIADVYRMDMSRQTQKANAFFTGLGNTKRIVLGDTMIDQFTPEEIEGVVAHELGHQVHGDIWRLVALGGAYGFGGAYAVHRLAPPFIARTGQQSRIKGIDDEASLPLIGLVTTLVAFAAAPIQAAISRAIERRTDRFALALTGSGRAYAATMRRLATQNLADPDPPRLVVFFLGSHPPIAERIAMAEAFTSDGGERLVSDHLSPAGRLR
ncbi:MAG: M48 family metallopeptidase [Chloroflexota bacterium]|nr:M48 family metallopeptidase [Chloroflexota bacterium]